MNCPIGTSAVLRRRVGDDYLASRWENDVDVLATPILLWLGELACMKVIEPYMQPDTMTVGVSHDAAHLAPTPAGFAIEISATLTQANGKLLTFEVTAADGVDRIFQGKHTRAVIDADRFRRKVAEKAKGQLLFAATGRANA